MKFNSSEKKVFKQQLENGLTLLVRPNHMIPRVMIQLWYNVGSKDEKLNEKGIAHLIEHMIFKGTKKLSESDINMITQKLSGSTNAFTSYDFTGYLFDLPSQHWHEALPIMADCMSNCLFKEEFLASEMKAVIQELKLYRDDYTDCLAQEMVTMIFEDHPYHYPIIGFKRDLWNLKRENLQNFYKKHYIPNNATLVVVGDVHVEDVMNAAKNNFGGLVANFDYKKEQFYHARDISSKSVTLYRDVQQPIMLFSWVLPGQGAKQDYLYDILSWIIGLGKGSRLYQILVDSLQIATDVASFSYDFFDYSLFFIAVQPISADHCAQISDIIETEISSLIKKGIGENELKRASKQTEANYFSLLEDNQKQAYIIGQSYLATGDENFLFNYLNYSHDQVKQMIPTLLQNYFRTSCMHKGIVLPLQSEDKKYWNVLQDQSDEEDERILSKITRALPVEKGSYVHHIKTASPKKFDFPKATKFTMDNGLKVLFCHNSNIPKIELVMSLQAKYYYDPDNLQGLSTFMTSMMIEGTEHYNAKELADAIESRGMSLSIVPGTISMSIMKDDLPIALELLYEILAYATFEHDAIEKVRTQVVADLKDYWDDPSSFINQLARNEIYHGHPYCKKVLGDFNSIKSINRQELITSYRTFMTPKGSVLAIVGDIEQYDIQKTIEKALSKWHGASVTSPQFPSLHAASRHTMNYKIDRDQVVLAYAGLSISRFDEHYDKVLLFNQILTGGVLGSMASRLFQLREQSGLFYSIGGSLLAHADEQPGMVYIKTILSLDRLGEAQQAIEETLKTAADVIHEYELQEAKDAIINSLVTNFESNKDMASTFLFLEQYKLPDDFFDQRPQQLAGISCSTIQKVVQPLLNLDHLVKLQVGRIEKSA